MELDHLLQLHLAVVVRSRGQPSDRAQIRRLQELGSFEPRGVVGVHGLAELDRLALLAIGEAL